MSTLEVKELSHPTGEVLKIATGKTLDLKSQGTTTLPTGSVLQVVQTYFTGTFATSVYSGIDITGLSVAITPSSTSSKILVTSTVSGFAHNDGPLLTLKRNGTTIGLADGAGSHGRMSFSGGLYTGDGGGSTYMQLVNTACYLDSPSSTSELTYKVYYQNTGNQLRVNHKENDSNDMQGSRSVSHITVQEIQG